MCKDWRDLSEAASREQDPKKLLELVKQLNEALAQREQNAKRMQIAEEQVDSADEKNFSVSLHKRETSICPSHSSVFDGLTEIAC